MDNTERGFSLVELSIVLIVLGIIISIGFKLLPNLVSRAEATKNTAALQRAQDALIGYAATHHRLPCPDDNNPPDGIGNPGTGPNTCAVAVGYLPYLQLGLTNGQDAYKRVLRYGVTTDYTTASTRGNDGNADLAYAWGSSADLCQAITNASNYARDYPTNTDHVYVYRTATTPAPLVTAADHQAFVLASAGYADKNGDGDFFDGANSGAVLFRPGQKQRFESPATPPRANYDDQVVAESFNKLSGELNCSSALQQNALTFVTTQLHNGTQSQAYQAEIQAEGGMPGASPNQYLWCVDTTGLSGSDLTVTTSGTSALVYTSGTCAKDSESKWTSADAIQVTTGTSTLAAGAANYSVKVFVRDFNDLNAASLTTGTPLDHDNWTSKTFSITVN